MIEIEDLSVVLSGNPILSNYSLRMAKGDVLAIMGANGIGKTTLLQAIMGMRKPTTGRVTISGQLGFVRQLFQAAFSYSVIDMVLMGRARKIGLFGSPSVADYDAALQLGGRVVEMHERRRGGVERCESALDQHGARLGEHVERNDAGEAPVRDEFTDGIGGGVRGRRKSNHERV